jgi:acetyl-CoA carboxylase carboxyl transferase subunit alpha
MDQVLPFERQIVDLQAQLEAAKDKQVRQKLFEALEAECKTVYANLSPWERVLLARHPRRPRMLDYTDAILEDLMELHGDRATGDDKAVIGGIGRFQGQTIMVIGQQKGVSTEEKVARNFGMAHPDGYRKALRLFKMAERLSIPIVTFVDTPAAHPGVEAEQGGQGPAIAENLLYLMGVKVPVLSLVLGEGGSGGALALAVGDRVAMFEHAIYVICPPERCAEILWRDAEKKGIAASAMRVTARELHELGVIDEVLDEPGGGAHRNPQGAFDAAKGEIESFLDISREKGWSPEKRQAKFRAMGVWMESE